MTNAPVLCPEPEGRRPCPRDLAHFEAIAGLAHAEAGLVLAREKAPMVLARVGKRMRAAGHADLAAYRAHLEGPDGAAERRELICTLTTNVTSFYRERHHFEILRHRLLPEFADRARGGGRVRLWSAGCSTGQEPYSLAMTVLDVLPEAAELDLRILATDIDAHVLASARLAAYSGQQVATLPADFRRRFLVPAGPGGAGAMSVSAAVRRLVAFRELNLLGPWPMSGRFDAIFCRNVVIYFDRDTQRRLWTRFAAALAPGGHLFVGHSERVDTTDCDAFRIAGPTTYQRAAEGAPARTGG